MAPLVTKQPASKKGVTVAYVTVALLLLFILVMLPFAVTSVFSDVSDQSATIFQVGDASPDLPVRADIHLQVTGVNEWDGTASIRVSTNKTCDRTCPSGDRFLFVSVYGDTVGRREERPSTQVVTLPADSRDVTQVINLPIYGDPIRYPFDSYRLAVGIAVDRILPENQVQPLPAAEAREYLSVSIQGRTPRIKMEAPQSIDPATLHDAGNQEQYAVVELLIFERPLYLKVLTVLLVLLVTAAAAYAVFLRPLDQLIINSGALVLGVWGIRSILLGTGVPGFTAVDLALSLVILFLLATITLRTLYLLEESSAVNVLRRKAKHRDQASPPPAPSLGDNVPERPGTAAGALTAIPGRGNAGHPPLIPALSPTEVRELRGSSAPPTRQGS